MISEKFYLKKSFDASKINWKNYKPNILSDMHEGIIRMNAAVEYVSLPAGISLIKQIPQNDIDLHSFIVKWIHDEHKHAFVLKEYASRFLPKAEVTVEEFEEVAIPFSDSPLSIAETMALHMCSELSVISWYQKMAEWHEEPLIKEIYQNFIIDESNHAIAFKQFMKKYYTEENKKGVLAIFQLFLTKKYFISVKMASTLDIEKKSVLSRLPNPYLFDHLFENILRFNEKDQIKIENNILKIASNLCGQNFKNKEELKIYRKSL